VTVITTRTGEQVHGMTANAFMSVSLEPPLVLISVDRRARLNAMLREGSRFGISVLAAGQESLSDVFARRLAPEEVEARFELVHDVPLVEGAIAHLVARVVRSYWGGDHSLFLGRVEYARYTPEQRPLLFHGGRYERLLRDAPVFSALPDEVLARILGAGVERSYEDGEAIVRAGEAGSELYVVVEGMVRVERAGRVMRKLREGDLFGEIAVLDGRPRTADAVTLEETDLLVLERNQLLPFLTGNPEVAGRLLAVLCQKLRQTSEHLEDALLREAPSRLARGLLRLAETFGQQRPSGVRIEMKLSQQQIGSLIGVSRESINRHIGDWTRAGHLAMEDGFLVIRDRALLERAAEAEA
jgi:CRP-like cAMP-binding protein